MRTKFTDSLKNKPTLWETGSHGTSLYVRPNGNGYDWIMESDKTGSHLIKTVGGLEPIMSERVSLHWDGFQKNQTR